MKPHKITGLPCRVLACTSSKLLLGWTLLAALIPLLRTDNNAMTMVMAASKKAVSAWPSPPSPTSSSPVVIKRSPTPPSPPSDALYICDPEAGLVAQPQGFRLYLDVSFEAVNGSNDIRDALALVFKVKWVLNRSCDEN